MLNERVLNYPSELATANNEESFENANDLIPTPFITLKLASEIYFLKSKTLIYPSESPKMISS